ncbi:MAG: site-2 protease family protein [Gemmataceae bacterium]
MRTSWKLGTAFGIGIYVHISFLLLPLYVLLENGTEGGLAVIGFMMALLAALFGCVVLHELGHALMARRFGIGTRDITLYPIGGVARLDGVGRSPSQELCIALAGPAVNVVIAALLCALIIPIVSITGIAHAGSHFGILGLNPIEDFLVQLMVMNVFMVLFNLLPVFPMDGGRVLRSLLSMKLGQLRATVIATRIGSVLALVMVFLAIRYGAVFLGIGAVFIWFAGQQELLALRMRERIRHADPIDVLPADDKMEYALTPPREANFSGYTWNDRLHAWVLWRDGRAVAAFSVPAE